MTLMTRKSPSPSQRGTRPFLFGAGLAAVFVVFLLAGSHRTQAQAQRDAKPLTVDASNPALVARGKYIVEDVAYCTNCHTPRKEDGSFDRTQWLMGGALFFRPPSPMMNWPQITPRLAGEPPTTDAGMVRLLTTGLWTDGKPLRQPMPQFHMTEADAEAVVAYLKSL